MHITHTHTHIYIYIYSVLIQNKSYAPELALGRRGVSSVSQWWFRDLLLHEDLLLVLFNHLLVLLLARGHEFHQFVLYMQAMMVQHLVLRQQQLLINNTSTKLLS